jgi:prophage regulatory protein
VKVLVFKDLQSKGIPFSRQHIHRLVKKKKFPAPFKVGEKTNAWDETVIDQHLADSANARMKTASTG